MNRAPTSIWLYLLLLTCVGFGRLVELGVSRRHQRRLSKHGVTRTRDSIFPWLVLTQVAIFGGSALEVLLLRRPLLPLLAMVAGTFLLLATALRWWTIATLGVHWNVRVMDSVELGVKADGPFRWVRHPNYLALIIELEALPLLHSAWIIALLGGLAHTWALKRRISGEEAMLMRHPEYRSVMAAKPRLLPRLSRS